MMLLPLTVVLIKIMVTLHGVTSAANRFGEMNKAFYFDGVDNYISIDSYTNMSPTTSVSIAAWIKTADTLTDAALIYDRLETQDGFGFLLNDSGYTRLSINGGSASCTAKEDVDDQEWHLVVGTYSFENQRLKIYIDASLSDTSVCSEIIDYSPEPRNQIGRTKAGENYFHGSIDEIRIYNRELPENEIIELYGNYTALDDDFNSGLITNYVLLQNYPNPFNPSTTISWQMPETGFVTLKIYDVLGREVTTLLAEEKPAGEYEVEYTVAQDSSPEITSGVYFYQLKVYPANGGAGNFIETKKILLLK